MNLMPALFTTAMIQTKIDKFVSDKMLKVYRTLMYIGEEFVNNARLKDKSMGGFGDITGNLRSSIGYAILHDGISKKVNLIGKAEGKDKAKELIAELSKKYNKGFVLIGFAGMEYAAAVESKGYDVITGSTPSANKVKFDINHLLSDTGLITDKGEVKLA